jgi:CheY-like chemotaxis protein
VLISDIGMAGDDGYMLMHEVRRRLAAKGTRIPAMALTAYAMADDAARALEAGFEIHVAKPTEPAHLIALVARLARPV